MADIELVIKIPEEMYTQIIDENGMDTMLIPYEDIIKNGTLLPNNATNGDIIKALFNPYKICVYEYHVHVYITKEDFDNCNDYIVYAREWWNAPYKGE